MVKKLLYHMGEAFTRFCIGLDRIVAILTFGRYYDKMFLMFSVDMRTTGRSRFTDTDWDTSGESICMFFSGKLK